MVRLQLPGHRHGCNDKSITLPPDITQGMTNGTISE